MLYPDLGPRALEGPRLLQTACAALQTGRRVQRMRVSECPTENVPAAHIPAAAGAWTLQELA